MGILFNPSSSDRTLLFRAIMLLGWYIIISLIIQILLIGIVAVYAGFGLAYDGAYDVERAFRAGYSARIQFFREYSDYIQYVQIAIVLALAALGKLPLTTKSDN